VLNSKLGIVQAVWRLHLKHVLDKWIIFCIQRRIHVEATLYLLHLLHV